VKKLIVALSAAVLLTGCGARQSSESAVPEAGDKTAAAGSSRIAVSLAGTDQFSIRATYDYDDGTSVVESGLGRGRAILTKDAAYLELEEPIEGKRWLKSPYPRADEDGGLFQPFGRDPGGLLRFLRAASDVEETGTGTERGEPVTRYKARLDVARALVELTDMQRESIAEMLEAYWPEARESGIQLELAVDGDGRLRRVDVPVPEYDRLTIEFYDYGVEVDAKPPPADEILALEDYWDELFEGALEE
jgi:hypothetical protein